MNFRLILLIFLLSANAHSNDASSVRELKQLLKSIIPTAYNKKTDSNKFNIHGCKDYQPQWMAYFIFKQDFEIKYKFGKTCDLDGKFKVSSPGPFPLKLKLKDFGKYNKIQMQTKIDVNIEKKTVNLTGTQGKLIGNNTHYFQINLTIEFELEDNKLKNKKETGVINFFKDKNYKNISYSEKIGS